MLNRFDFMGIIISDIRFLPKFEVGNSTEIAHARLCIPQDWDIKIHDKSNAFFCTVICYGKLASYIAKWGQKNDLVVGSGHLRNSHWKTKSGEERYSTDVVAEKLYLYVLSDPRRKKYAEENGGEMPKFSAYHEPGVDPTYFFTMERVKTNNTEAEPLIDGTVTQVPDDTKFPNWSEKK